jgi:hypothetical protein
VHSLTYVRLGQENGGIIIDLSEEGVAVRAAMPIHEDTPVLLFQLEGSKDWIQTRGRVVWQRDASKSAGIQFVDISEAMRNVIDNWIAESEPQGQRKLKIAARSRAELFFEESSARAVSASPDRDVATEHERIARNSLTTFSSAIGPARALVLKSNDSRAVVPFAERAVNSPEAGMFASPERTEEARPADAIRQRKWRAAILIGFLMCLSGLTGWLVGRGTPNRLRRMSYATFPENSDRATKGPVEVPDIANQDVANPPPAVAPRQESPLQDSKISGGTEEGWVFLGQLTPDLSWAQDQPRYVQGVEWPINKGDHITLSHDVWVHQGSSPHQPVVGSLHFGESTLVEDVDLSRAKAGGYFVWVKVGQNSAP